MGKNGTITLGIICLALPVWAQGTAETIEAAPAGSGAADTSKPTVSKEVEATPTDEAPSVWSTSSGSRGTLGTHRVEAAHPLPPGELVLTIGGSYSMADGFLVSGDHNTHQIQTLSIVWALPWLRGLELQLSQRAVSNDNSAFEPRATQSVGDPELGIKFSYPFMDWMGAGALVAMMFPTSPRGSGLKPEALKLTMLGAFSMAPTSWIELSFNAGYIVDETGNLFKRTIDAAKQYSAEVAHAHQIVAGLGVATNFNLFDVIGLGPFAEFHMRIATQGAGGGENPILASVGAKIYPAKRPRLELTVGTDIRLTGAPDTGTMPGVPPWEIFGRVTAHLFMADKEPPKGTATLTCQVDTDCSAGFQCFEGGRCGVLREVEVIKEVIKTETLEIVKPAPTFFIEGTVVNQASGKPIPDAKIKVVGTETSALSVDPKTGKFKSYPLLTGEGLVQLDVSAPNFAAVQQPVPRGQPDEVKAVAFELQHLGKQVGELRGSLKDARTGSPIKGLVFIPTQKKKVEVSKEGSFKEEVKTGTYQVLISSKGYITQKKTIEILAGDVVILNIDLEPKRP